jgi:hypothetical protein
MTLVKSKPFRATVKVNGLAHHLGYFSTVEAAHAAYEDGARRLFGEFARTA